MENPPVITKKVLIMKKYIELQKLLRNHFEGDLFPDIRSMDVVDIIFYFNLYFNNKDDYRTPLKKVLDMKCLRVDDDKFEEIYNIVLPFVQWLKLQ